MHFWPHKVRLPYIKVKVCKFKAARDYEPLFF
jgi:hypothetical protein